MGIMVGCIVMGLVAVACLASLLATRFENATLRRRFAALDDADREAARITRITQSQLADAELEAARLVNIARGRVLDAEDHAAQIVADANAERAQLEALSDDVGCARAALQRLRHEIQALEDRRIMLQFERELEGEDDTGVFRTMRPHAVA